MKNLLLLILLCSFPLVTAAYIPEQAATFSSQRIVAGKILVARKPLSHGIFRESVILLTRHDQHGTIGLILNRPSKLQLNHIISGLDSDENENRLFIGGPVGSNVLSVLVKTNNGDQGLSRIVANIYHGFAISLEDAGRYVAADAETVRFYSGYAGWSKGQLEAEINRDSWYVIDTDFATLLDTASDSLWQSLIRKITN